MVQQPIPNILSFLLNACGEATGGSRQVRICNALERLLPGKGLCHDVASFNNQGIVKAPYTFTGGILCRLVMGSQKSQKTASLGHRCTLSRSKSRRAAADADAVCVGNTCGRSMMAF